MTTTKTALSFTTAELQLLHRAVDLLQKQDAIADNEDKAIALDDIYCRLCEALGVERDVDTYIVGDQPFTCPQCGARTERVNDWEWCRAHGYFDAQSPEIVIGETYILHYPEDFHGLSEEQRAYNGEAVRVLRLDHSDPAACARYVVKALHDGWEGLAYQTELDEA